MGAVGGSARGQMGSPLLGRRLLATGMVSHLQLADALLQQATMGGRLGEILFERGSLSEAGLALALSRHLGLPLVDLSHASPPAEAAALLPETVARGQLAVPIGVDGDELTVAVADPTPEVADALQASPHAPVRIVVARRSEVQRAIDTAYTGCTGAGRGPATLSHRQRNDIRSTECPPGARRGAAEPEGIETVTIEPQRRRASLGRLLVVEDDAEVRRVLLRMLEAEGYDAAEAESGDEAIAVLANGTPDLILLDLVLAGQDGFGVLAEIRRSSDVPVIIVSGKVSESDRVLGLRLGADDYVVKPFSGPELAARIASVLRRYSRAPGSTGSVLEFGDLRIDTQSREVRLDGALVETTMKEFDLLAFLASSPRQVFSREQLLAHVWGSSVAWQDDGTVTEHVRRLRHKLSPGGARDRWISTVRGVGYRFEP